MDRRRGLLRSSARAWIIGPEPVWIPAALQVPLRIETRR